MTTDTSERGLERLICTALTGSPCDAALAQAGPEDEAGVPSSGVGWICGAPNDYNREYTVDLAQLLAFLVDTQPEAFEGLRLEDAGPARRKVLARLQGEITKRGTIDVLRHGPQARRTQPGPLLRHAVGRERARRSGASSRTASPSSGSFATAATRRSGRSVIGLFINGLPGLHVRAEEQPHQADRSRCGVAVPEGPQPPREAVRVRPLRGPASRWTRVDVRSCTHLKGKASWFLPFNRGWNDGAGNPPNSSGIKTDYLWLRR